MKLKELLFFERIFNVFIGVVMIPFFVVHAMLFIIEKPFQFVFDKLVEIRHSFGNMLLKKSDEVKNGTIKNEMCIRTYTASFAYKELKRVGILK